MGQKSQFPNFSVNWGKFGNAIRAFQKSQFPISFMNWEKLGKIGKNTAPDQHFKIQMLNLWMSWENLCPNLSFTLLKIRWGIYIKEDGHISNLTQMIEISYSLKFREFINELGKTIFHWGKWNEPIKLIKECVTLKIKI